MTSKSTKYQVAIPQIAMHMAYWLLYLWLASFLNNGYDPRFEHVQPPVDFITWAIWNLPFKLALFYTYFLWLIPQWLYKKPFYFLGCSLLLLLVYPISKVALDQWASIDALYFIEFQMGSRVASAISIIDYSLRAMSVLGGALMAFIARTATDWFTNKRRQRLQQLMQLESEIAMLRNQVNPHFLFNTLNNIDSMIYKVSPEGSEAIGKLAAIMRYMLYESNVEQVTLSKELNYLQDFIDLQRLRFRTPESVKMEILGSSDHIQIAPMLFIPFIENAFKHGVVQKNGELLNCSIRIDGQKIYFQLENGCAEQSQTSTTHKIGGIGLANVKRRLELLYPHKYTLSIRHQPPIHHVSLMIDTE